MWSVKISVFVTLAISFAMCTESAVICYYGTWATYRHGNGKFDVEQVDPHLCTHVIYSFAGINDQGKVISLDPWLDLPNDGGRDNYRKFNTLKQKNPSLKTILGVGGWNEGSAKYSMMAASTNLRKNFIESVLTLLQTYGFDGLDIDWEYPNRRDTVHGKADIDNYTTLLRELREAFDPYGFNLSAGVSAVEEAASLSYDIPAISQYLDSVNLMTYDMAGAWDPVIGYNAPLHSSSDGNSVSDNSYTVDKALQYWINAGCPPEKIAIGVPFFALTFTLADYKNNGAGALSRGPGLSGPYTVTPGTMGYNEFCYKLKTETWTKRYDSSAKVPYAFKDVNWVSYDDADSITTKINYAKSLGISKVMVWSIETDDFKGLCDTGVNPLLSAINKALGDGDSNIDITTTPPISPLPPSTPTTSTVSSTKEPAQEDVCQQEGFASNPRDCSSFFMCVKDPIVGLRPTKFQCPPGLYWDQANSVCEHQHLVKCEVNKLLLNEEEL